MVWHCGDDALWLWLAVGSLGGLSMTIEAGSLPFALKRRRRWGYVHFVRGFILLHAATRVRLRLLHPSTPRKPTLPSVSMLHSRERDMNIYFAIPKTWCTSPVHNRCCCRCRWLQHRLWNTVCVGLSCASNNKPIIRRCRSCRCRHHVNGA